MKISVCIITLKREKLLIRLIESLVSQELKEIFYLEIIIVENSPEVSVEIDKFINEIKNDKIMFKFSNEKRKGIPYARNKTLSLVSQDSDYIIFIDDDEYIPSQKWILTAVNELKFLKADVVMSGVIPNNQHKGITLNRTSKKRGTTLQYAATNNTILKSSLINDYKFNEDFANTGGSDTEFFYRIHKDGYSIVYSDLFPVMEEVFESRANLRWHIKRAFREGLIYTRVKKMHDNRRDLLICLLKTIVKLIISVIKIPLLAYKKNRTNILRNISRSIGEAFGYFGFKYNEYKKIHS